MHKNKGFTLPELMIAMAVGSIIMAVIYSTYQAQQKSYTTQHLAVEMQQNIRAAMTLMKREIRMAGYDPTESGTAGISSAAGNLIQFSFDNNNNDDENIEDGDTNDQDENLRYGFTTGDGDSDGIADDGAESLYRIDANGSRTEVIAYDIQGIAFAYAFDDDGDGQLDTSPGGNVIWAMDTDDDDLLDSVLDDTDNGVIDAADAEGGFPLVPAFWTNTVPRASPAIVPPGKTAGTGLMAATVTCSVRSAPAGMFPADHSSRPVFALKITFAASLVPTRVTKSMGRLSATTTCSATVLPTLETTMS